MLFASKVRNSCLSPEVRLSGLTISLRPFSSCSFFIIPTHSVSFEFSSCASCMEGRYCECDYWLLITKITKLPKARRPAYYHNLWHSFMSAGSDILIFYGLWAGYVNKVIIFFRSDFWAVFFVIATTIVLLSEVMTAVVTAWKSCHIKSRPEPPGRVQRH